MIFKHDLFVLVLYVSSLFSSYEPLKIVNISYTTVFSCGVYYIKKYMKEPRASNNWMKPTSGDS